MHAGSPPAHLLDVGQRDGRELGANVGDGARAPAPDECLLRVHQRDGAQARAEAAAVHLRACAGTCSRRCEEKALSGNVASNQEFKALFLCATREMHYEGEVLEICISTSLYLSGRYILAHALHSMHL